MRSFTNKFKLWLAAGALALGIPAVAVATSPIQLGGSIFPLTLVTVPVNNMNDAFNQMLILINAQVVGLSTVYTGAIAVPAAGVDTSGVVFSQTIQQNPLVQQGYFSIPTASAVAGQTLMASQSGRKIVPSGQFTLMVSGDAATATSVVLKCANTGTTLATFPIAWLKNNVPVGPLSSSGVVAGAALTQGCASSDTIMVSVNGNLTTTAYMYVNMPYTVQ